MKRNIIIVVLNALFLIAFIACQLISASIITPFHNQQAAKAWAGQSGERFAQLSVFFPESYAFDVTAIASTRHSINTKLLAASLESDQRRVLFTDAWAAYGEVSVIGNRGNPVNASVIGVGGDFFMFHPLRLRHGSYLSPSDVMKDRVLLDEDLAWRLFGSVHLAGMEVLINGIPFIVAGVIERESDFASRKAYEGGEGLYMHFEALDAFMDGEAKIVSYEVVMPDPVSDFAFNIIDDIFDNDSIHIVKNTSRFSFSNQLELIRSFGERSIRTDTIVYPYWENAVRYAEDWLALLLVLSIIFLICPIVFGVIYAIKLLRFGARQLVKLIKRLIKKRDDRAYRRYKIKQDTL